MGITFNPTTGQFDDAGQTKVNQVIVRAKEQLAGILESGKVYFIDGSIDMGTQSIEVPEGGLTLEGHGYDISKLYSTENNYTMFTTPSGSYSGNLTVNRNTLYVTGVSSRVFDVDNNNNFGALELNTVNIGDFPVTTTSFGNISNYRQIRTSNFAGIKYTEGFTLTGNIAGIAFNDSIILASITGSTFIKAGTGLLITDGMSSNMNALSLSTTSKWCDFSAANFVAPALMTLNNFRTGGDAPIPNIDANTAVALFRGCTGVANTFVGANWVLSTQVESNTTANKTLKKLAGTTTASLDAWFDAPVSNRLRYLGNKVIKVDVLAEIELFSNQTESFEVTARQWDDSASVWINLRTAPIETALKILGDRRGSRTLIGQAILDTNDYIEIWYLDASVAGTANCTLALQSVCSINERQS